jgi:uncharacterized protein (TIGR03086 family)
MTEQDDVISVLDQTLDQTGELIANAKPDQAGLPTPCASFDLRALIDHIAYDLRMFTDTAQDLPRPPAGEDLIGDDWSGAFDAGAAGLMEVWRRPGMLERTYTSPMGELPATWRLGQQIADFAVHGWDVAKATGQPSELDPDVAQFALDWGRENLKPEFRGEEGSGKAFGLEVAVPEEALLYDRLAGFFGRDPSAWT